MKRTRLTARDREHVSAVFETHRRFVEAVAIQCVGVDDAPDVVQEVGVRMCESLNGLRDPDAVRAWLHRTTVNAARSLTRGRGRLEAAREQLGVSVRPETAVVHPDDHLRERERSAALVDALNRLKHSEKNAIGYICGFSGVSISGGDNRMTLSRARARLRQLLRQDPRFRTE